TLLGELISWKEERPNRMLAVGGCMVQQREVADRIARKFRHVDIIFGTHLLPHFLRLLETAGSTGKMIVEIGEEDLEREGLPVSRKNRFPAWVPVIYGCNNFCSYCIVPHVRGREHSRPLHRIVNEVKSLGKSGYREVTLLGQNVNAYGKDLTGENSFHLLLDELSKVPEISRIRYMTSHPRDFEERIIEVIARSENICEHFHLPIQSGSNRILEKMNRGYSCEYYVHLVETIRNYIPAAAITTDFIVGFPGEEEEDFMETMALIDQIRFDAAFSFLYSERRGTPASKMGSKIPRKIKRERIMALNEKQQEIGLQINSELIGSVEEVLVEGVSKNDPHKLTGRTRTNKLVHFEGNPGMEGDLIDLRIGQAGTWHLSGEPEKERI
ncbi:MAG: tRNA (N6-isopentenyl adenosine(37)-C2)-methylthiotransferase MiaB, partial [Firmicutes bacterium]|nr:tRNA (N6-isopentenyl adenosine(37)-C2)-methylthiotransferase MiaB [Bacillota bacterium]